MDLNPYAKFLDGKEPIPVLTTTIDRLRALTASLTPAQIDRSPAPDKWSIREIVAHLADWAEKDRNALLCQLNSYSANKEGAA